MKFSTFLFCALTLSFFVSRVNAQNGNTNYFQPSIFPTAPNTAAFARFGSYPVNLYSGVPDISIPLYTIECGGLKVPITLSYHAAGVKITDAASWAGLGWSLNCGGSITRKVYGLPDEVGYLQETKRALASYSLQNRNDNDYIMETVEKKWHDNMPDIYAYQIPGYSGKFFFDADSSFKIMMIPRTPVVVSTYGASNAKFDIKDEHGNTYRLGYTYQEVTSTPNATPSQATSAWMLENMISQDRRDSIIFNYTSGSYQLPDGMSETISVEDQLDIFDASFGANYSANTTPLTSLVNNPSGVSEQQLSTVYFKNGKVDFITDPSNRQDLSVKALDTLKVSLYNFARKKYEVQKSIVFVHSYFGPNVKGSQRLRLDGIQILDKAGSIVNQYYFSYNNTITMPPYGSLARDYWGYYNGQDNSTDLIPQTSIQMISSGGGLYNINIGNPNDPNSACRNIDTTKMQACVLTSITYPTGGHTNFTYQTNRYIDANSNIHLAGGLRIASISSYDSPTSMTPIVKTYQYGTGQANFYADPSVAMNYGLLINTQTYRYWSQVNQIGSVIYAASKRVRRWYAQPNEDLELDGVPVAYTQVTEYNGTPAANIGKSVYAFSWTKSTLETAGGITGIPIYDDFSYSNGKLLSKKDYMRKSDGTYQIMRSDNNTYGAFAGGMWPGILYDGVGIAMGQRQYNDGALMGGSAYYGVETPDDEQSYFLGDFAIQSGDDYLTSTTTKTYDQSDSTKYIQSAVIFKYDNLKHQQVNRVYHTDSKGNTVVSVTKYPADYSAGNAVIDSMVRRNMQAEEIEKWDTLKNAATGVNAVTSAQLNIYKTGSSNAIIPSTVSILNINSPLTGFVPSSVSSGTLSNDTHYTQMISFDQYDYHNNILQYTTRNSTPVSIVWDYLYDLPVAQIKNATNNAAGSEVYYTSFEAPRTGSWYYTGTPMIDVTAPTGSYSYPLSSGAVSLSYFDLSKSYVLSLWSNNGAPTVTTSGSLTGTALRTANGWTYYEYTVPVSTSTITISGSMSIDELRLYPVDAQMTTYAYDPSGLRQISDTKGQISYFEYDFAQRLKNIKDWNGNIVKNFGYHYYDMIVSNDAFGPTTFTRNNCPAGTSPQSTTYSVPAAKYYASTKAAANAEAQYDLNTNGQALANNPTVCGCPVTMVNFTLSNSSGYTAYQVTFSGISTPYNFPASGNTIISVPAGTYSTVTIGTSATSHTFSLTGYTNQVNHSASFSNVAVTTGSNLTLTATP